jgi:hypothetical protein
MILLFWGLIFSVLTGSQAVITLERTACFGTCPVYKLAIKSDGTVEFRGMRIRDNRVVFDDLKNGKIRPEQLKTLIAAFKAADYWSFKDQYEFGSKDCVESWTDHPSAITSLTIDGRSKSVTHYHGCTGVPRLKTLTELENKIDEVVNTKQWLPH